MKVKQSSWLGSNHVNVTESSGGGLAGLLALGAAAAMVVFAYVVGTALGAAAAAAITILAWTACGAVGLTVGTISVLRVLHYRRNHALPPSTFSLLTINRPMYTELPPPSAPRMTVSRADYPDGVYPVDRGTP